MTGVQQDLEKQFISLKQGRENTEWHKISYITCQVQIQTHPGFLLLMRLELGSQMSSQRWPCSDPDRVMREGTVTLRSSSLFVVVVVVL